MISRHYLSSLVVVDTSVADREILLESIHPNTRVLILDRDRNGIEQISEVLAAVETIDSLHILSHGRAGMLQLGSTCLSWQTLEQHRAHLQSWAQSLGQGAEILLYGCKVAAGALGQSFVQQLKRLTGAEVAASTNLTGSSAASGDWVLEYATGTIKTPIAFSPAAMAAYPHVLTILITDTFREADVRDLNWRVGTGSAVPGSPAPVLPFLTARNTTALTAGGIPGNPALQLDAPGQGALRLTNNLPDQSAFVLYDQAIGSRQGLTVTFELFAYGGTTNPGADGVSFFLLDGQVSPTQAGAFGGSLGYAQKNVTPTAGFVPGLQGAYVGIGFDEFGNFSSQNDAVPGVPVRTSGAQDRIPDSIGVRAGEVTNYQYVTGTGTLPFGIDNLTATTRDAARRTVRIDLTPTGLLTVQIDGNNDGDFLDPNETVPELTNFNIANINGVIPPETLKFGFASATGDFNNIHEIRNLIISTLNNPPTALDFAEVVPPDAPRRLTGFAGTDPDIADGDRIASYSILTLPSNGTLYRGNPTSGGRAITALPPGGLTLTPEEIQNIYFQATPGFEGATFTYTVTDSRGSSDASPATVTLTLEGITLPDTESKVCLTGRNRRGNNKDNRIDGTPNTDALFGRGGNDRLRGFDCPDRLNGGTGNDNLIGGGARDRLRGQQNDDVVRGNAGNDEIDLGLGNDRGFGGRGNDAGLGRRGKDRLEGRGGDDNLAGGHGSDELEGNSNNDFLDGQQDNDRIRGGKGSDTLNGGLGSDRLRGTERADSIMGRRGDDVVWGGVGQDRILGHAGNDRLSGNPQADILNGGAGSDVIVGGTGNDRIRTGGGSDRVVYRSAQQGIDTIVDFNVNVDVISLREIFDRPQYTSTNSLRDYVRITDEVDGAVLQVDSNGEAAGGFLRLALLQGVEATSLNLATNFLI